MKIAISAVDKNYGIGYNNKLLFKIPKDQKFFKLKTIGNVVVMGRKTFESIGRPRPFGSMKLLPYRINIVISSREDIKEMADGKNLLVGSLDQVRNMIKDLEPTKDIYIIGGSSIYNEFIDECDRLILTKYDREYEKVDSYFPIPEEHGFSMEDKTIMTGFYEDYPWKIVNYYK